MIVQAQPGAALPSTARGAGGGLAAAGAAGDCSTGLGDGWKAHSPARLSAREGVSAPALLLACWCGLKVW